MVEAITQASHTIHRFSDHFQYMHERSIRQHAQSLEQEVSIRTAELAESERRYKTLVEEINDGYFVIQNGRIVFANQAFCRMHGTTPVEVVGQPFLRFVTPEWRERLEGTYVDALAGKLTAIAIEIAGWRSRWQRIGRTADLGQGRQPLACEGRANAAMEQSPRVERELMWATTASLSTDENLRHLST
jgi:PAS domain-containing protein